MTDVMGFQRLRSLGKLEQLSGACHHLGFYHNVGVSAHYYASAIHCNLNLRNLIFAAVQVVIRQHGILSAIPVNEYSPEGYFARLPSIDLVRSVLFIRRSQPVVPGEQDSELDAILEEQHNTNFKGDYGNLPFWRLLILQEPGVQDQFTASFIFHHSIGDGIAGLIFHKYFGNALEAAEVSTTISSPSVTDVYVAKDIALLPPLEGLHPLPIDNSQTASLPAEKLEQWTGGLIRAPCVTRYQTLYLSPSITGNLIHACRQNSLSLTSVLAATIAAALFDFLPSSIGALTGIIPMNLRPWLRLPRNDADNAIGTFIDAFQCRLHRSDFNCIGKVSMPMLPAAEKVSHEIKRRLLGNMSPSGEPFTSVAAFKTIPEVSMVVSSTLGKERDSAFEVSNLGQFSSGTEVSADANWRVGRMTFSRSSVVSGSAITMSIVSGGDDALTIGFSWQKNVIEEDLVQKIISRVRQYVEYPHD